MLDDHDLVHVDLACLQCEYNLRTMHLAANCPECGTPVEASVRVAALEYAPADWLRRIASGVGWVLVSIGVMLGGWVLLAILFVVCAMLARARIIADEAGVLLLGISYPLLAIAFCAAAILGVLGATARHPQQRGKREGWTARRLLRVSVWLLPLPPLAGAVLALDEWGLGLRPPVRADLGAMAVIGGIAACLVIPGLLLLHLHRLLARTHHERLVRSTRRLVWAIALCGLLAASGAIGRRLLGSRPTVPPGARAATVTLQNDTRMNTVPYAGGVVAPTAEVRQAGKTSISVLSKPTLGERIAAWCVGLARWGGLAVGVVGVVLLLLIRRTLLAIAARSAAWEEGLARDRTGSRASALAGLPRGGCGEPG